MQVRTNGINVKYCPIFLCYHITEETHDIVANAYNGEHIVLNFHLSGVTSYLPVCLINENKWNQRAIPRVKFTNHNLPWDPNSSSYEYQENAMYDYRGKFVHSDPASRVPLIVIIQMTASTHNEAADFTDDDNFANIL